jgi:hypothetical protein
MLERKDVKVGDLLIATYDGGLRKHPILGTLYLVRKLEGYGKHGIYVMEVKTGRKIHCETRWFKKTDKFCP